jgi:response regulator of citrate/malate metabolism
MPSFKLVCARRTAISTLVQIDRALTRPGGLSVRRTSEDLGMSSRTVRHYLEFIRDRLGLRVEYDPFGHVWRYADSDRIFTRRVYDFALD